MALLPYSDSRVQAVLSPMDAPLQVWNTANQPALVMSYQFETAQPADLWRSFTGWTAFSQNDRAAMRSVLDEYESVINVRFVEDPNVADPDINFGRVDLSYGGEGGFSYSWSQSGSTVTKTLDSYAVFNKNLDLSANRSLVLHEFGHAMTLKHTGNYDAGGHLPPGPFLPADQDNNKYSVMSYNVNPDNGADSDHLMLYDIAALQARFGANTTTRTGNDVYTGPNGNIQVIWDAGGVDTINGSAYSSVKIDLREGYFSSLGATDNLAIAFGVTIENAVGSVGNDTLTGNHFANVINGGGGNDMIDGRGGGDTLIGGLGDDRFIVRASNDKVVELAGQGNDTVLASANYVLGAGVHVERLETTGFTGTAAIDLYGNELAQTILGNDGANRLDSGAGAADTLIGRSGNDTYIVRNAGDKIVELAGQGTDSVFATVSYILGGNVSVENLSTSSLGGLTAINLTGNTLAQTITGNDGANRLDSGGGVADTLIGRGGNDTYIVRNAGDKIVELAGQGSDTVYANTSYVLTAGASVETLGTTSLVGTAAINLTGNAQGQNIFGNDGANVLNGGAGNDALIGRGGADTFVFNTALNAATNVDTILDYNAVQDVIHLENAVFTGLANGALAASAFFAGAGATAAADALDRIIYNTSSGALYFDADGAGGAAAIQFATLTGAPTINSGEFLVI